MFNIVLLEPEIPANTGNIGRTCLVTGSRLHLIEPMGFIINDKNLKRAGMDYWQDLDVTIYDSLRDFVQKNADAVNFPEGILERFGRRPEDMVFKQPCEKSLYMDNTVEAGNKKSNIWFASTKALKTHDMADFKDGDYIMFGKESAGIPEGILLDGRETCIRIPMAKEQRSLNLSNSVAVVLYEALRQNDYLDLELKGQLHYGKW